MTPAIEAQRRRIRLAAPGMITAERRKLRRAVATKLRREMAAIKRWRAANG